MLNSSTFFQILMKVNFPQQTSEKYSYINFHENPSSWSRVVAWGRVDRFTDMTKLTALSAILRIRLRSWTFPNSIRKYQVTYGVFV